MADSPPSSMQPVVYDRAAFDAAIAEVNAAINRLTDGMDNRIERAAALTTNWTGMAAGRFRGEYERRLIAVHLDVLGELRATRENLRLTLDAIDGENTTRAGQREQWEIRQAQKALAE